jgi:hypothetical protein
MYDYILEEMAEAIAREFRLDNNDVLGVLSRYWQDKIAHVWQVEDVLEAAHRAEKPITREDALTILQQVFHGLDSELGITWLTVDVALEEYSLDFNTLTSEAYSQVAGVFEVWRKYDAVSVQFGLFPNQMDGNLPEALEFAKQLARKVPGVPVHLGCERYASEETEPWLTILLKDGQTEPTIEESEETCTPSSPDNASAS